MEIERSLYLDKLIKRQGNGMVKVITGVRRCGKSYLLFRIFRDYLIRISYSKIRSLCQEFS